MKRLSNWFFNYTKDNSLIRDGFLLFSATMILNFSSYLFHFYMGRVLGPSDYGILGALLSIVYFISVPFNTIQTTVTKTVSELVVGKNYEKIKYFIKRLLKILFLLSLGLILIFLASVKFISGFLGIPVNSLFVLSFFILFALLLPITRGVLQGLQLFKKLSFTLVFEGITKILFGYLLVRFGLGVNGAISAIIISYIIPFVIAFYYIKFIFSSKEKSFSSKSFSYSIPVLVALSSLTAFFTVDVIVVKHFFSEILAGYYAALSIIGKTIFFATFSITAVMFPKVSEMHTSKKDYRPLFSKSIVLILIVGGFMALFYFLFPGFIINIFFGSKYLFILPYLGKFSLFILFYSLCYIICFYNLAIRRYNFIYILIIFNIIQIVMLNLFHQSIPEVIEVLLYLMVILFLLLFIYTKNETIHSNPGI